MFPSLNLQVRRENCREVNGDNFNEQDGAAKILELPEIQRRNHQNIY